MSLSSHNPDQPRPPSVAGSTPTLCVRDVCKSFGAVRAVRGISFELCQGEVVGLMGPNGAGKTTTIRMITGYFPPDAGSISVMGHDSMRDSLAARRCIGSMPEAAPLYAEMAVEDYLDFRCRLFGLSRGERKAAVGKGLERCRLGEVRRRRIGQLSKGFKQRVGLASSLLHEPPIVVLDEPTDGLDPTQVRDARALIRELAQSRTMLICSHVLPEVEQMCSRVILIAGGVVRADGTPAQIAARSGDGQVFTLEVKSRDGTARHLEGLFMKVQGVADVLESRLPDGWTRLKVRTHAAMSDPRERLAVAADDAELVVRELSPVAASLERAIVSLLEEPAGVTEAKP